MLIVDGVELYRVFWSRGSSPKGAIHRYEIKDTPCSGWQNVLLLRGEKRSTLFCPYTMTAFQVTNHSGEMASMVEPQPISLTKIAEILLRNWNQSQKFGWQRDYDTAALIFKLLGQPVPEQIMRGGEEDTRKRGGKTVGKALTKPVKKDSKRGVFLQWFMDNNNARSVREAMVQFSMSRSNALSYLFMLRKDHGIGYALQGDIASLEMPEGCTNPFVSQDELDQLDSPVDEDVEIDDGDQEGLEEPTVVRSVAVDEDEASDLEPDADKPVEEVAEDDEDWLK